jgi:hypothetical protein
MDEVIVRNSSPSPEKRIKFKTSNFRKNASYKKHNESIDERLKVFDTAGTTKNYNENEMKKQRNQWLLQGQYS